MTGVSRWDFKKDVHIYRQGDLNIAYDVNSGSLHVLDDDSFAVLKALEELSNGSDLDGEETAGGEPAPGGWAGKIKARLKNSTIPEQEISEILDELKGLQAEGTLFSPAAEEQKPVYPETPIIKAICLHVAHDCNLRCAYCFAGTGAFGGKRTLMDAETGKRAIDFVLKASGHRRQCEVDFFGGEPLLNLQVVKELVRYGKAAAAGRDKTIKFTMTTNGILLNEKTERFLEEENISVVLSLDGRPEVHDRMRPYADGRGSYAEVAPIARRFAARHPDSSPYAVGTYYYVRGTYTHYNLDFDKDVLHMADLGIDRISLEPVVAGPENDYAFRAEDLAVIKDTYDRLAEEILARRAEHRDFTFFHFNVALDQGPCLPKRLSGCGAGHEYLAVSPEGDLYPCHQFVGQPEYKMGSLWGENAGRLDLQLVEKFRGAHVYAKKSCRNCWARFTCSGGCHASNSAYSKNLLEVYPLGCELQKKRLEVALYLKAKEAARTGSDEKEQASVRC